MNTNLPLKLHFKIWNEVCNWLGSMGNPSKEIHPNSWDACDLEVGAYVIKIYVVKCCDGHFQLKNYSMVGKSSPVWALASFIHGGWLATPSTPPGSVPVVALLVTSKQYILPCSTYLLMLIQSIAIFLAVIDKAAKNLLTWKQME